ncbi:hypothetical protein Pan216_34150 [Planctomycetes bacterium Pan216]|uniref:Flagellin N-methylase n=1 Tax=Kolteria novifilia TaxID=2527975 RepID=A0A518B6E7_9BACT|nr:hypothetical protein Pan216_34150 [Planctomycetes bacterium Pan216]
MENRVSRTGTDSWWREKLISLYESIDEQISEAGPRCEASGKCCRFKEFDHTLFLTEPEAELLLEPGLPPGPHDGTIGCPYQVGGLCTARERRPVACRTFFCDPSFEEKMVTMTEDSIGRLKAWHRESGRAWTYRPLAYFLGDQRAPQERSSLPVLHELT